MNGAQDESQYMDGLEALYQDPFEEQTQKVKMEQEATNESSTTSTPVRVAPKSNEDVLSRSIYVKNVDYSTTVKQLEEHFKDCGPIVRTTIKTGPQGKPLGFAYMEFSTIEGAVRSKTKNDTSLLGRTISVQ